MKQNKKHMIQTAVLLVLFLLFTLAVKLVDVRPVGPQGSEVGFAALNGTVFNALGGYHPLAYRLTEYLGILPIAVVCCFGLLGLCQLLRRRSLKKVDPDLYVLALLYAAVAIAYGFFEICVVNCRPIDLGTGPEASYPSSHTMLAICVMSTAITQLRTRMKRASLRRWAVGTCAAVLAVIVVGRLVSGVHWLTDIVGSLLLSAALLSAYRGGIAGLEKRKSDM